MKTIDIVLACEGVVLEGTLAELNVGTAERPYWVRVPRWRCPCGTEIDTGALAEEQKHHVTGGYGLNCPGCVRWYMHHTALGYVGG